MSPKNPTSPTSRHAERYRRERPGGWDHDSAVRELRNRIMEATPGLDRERARNIAESYRADLLVSGDGQLRVRTSGNGSIEAWSPDPFALLVGRITNLIDAEGALPQPKTLAEVAEALRQSVPYGNP